MIEVYAPGRAELLGNHTDYNEGYVLAIAVDRGTTVRGEKRDDGLIRLTASDLGESVEVPLDEIAPRASGDCDWANYSLGVVDQMRQRGHTLGGFEMTISTTLPMGAGLSSSAALEVSTGLFLARAFGLSIEPLEMARIAQAAEHTYAGVKCGLLDQISSISSKQNHVTSIDCRSFAVDTLPLIPGTSFVIVNSNVKHALVEGEYNERRASCEAAAASLGLPALRDADSALLENAAKEGTITGRALKRARHIVGENERVIAASEALRAGDAKLFGKQMFASHVSSIENFENSTPELDALVETARGFDGCYGARLSGGGFGGATINLVDDKRVDAFVATMVERHPKAQCLTTPAASGARVVVG